MKQFVSKMFEKFGLLFALVLLCIALSFVSEHFLTAENLLNVLLQSANIGILAVGITLVIITAEIDLSVGAVETLATVVVSYLMFHYKLNLVSAITVAMLAGVACGYFNGIFVQKFGVHSFITTLAMMGIARGLALVMTEGKAIYAMNESFKFIGQGYVGPVPFPVILMIGVFLCGHVVLTRTRTGVNIFAVGGNISAAVLSGINAGRVKLLVLMISGLTSAIAGIVMASRLNAGMGTIGAQDVFDAIAAVVIGGTSLMGGIGSMWGSFVGVLIIGVIRNGLNLLAVTSFWQLVAIGCLILVAVIVDEIRKKRLAVV
jgi:ribose/xylose/arabinose/galactoside ABC-type transport system permease subunit